MGPMGGAETETDMHMGSTLPSFLFGVVWWCVCVCVCVFVVSSLLLESLCLCLEV